MNKKVYIVALVVAALAAVAYLYFNKPATGTADNTTLVADAPDSQKPLAADLPPQNDPGAVLTKMPLSKIGFTETSHNFGKITEGEKVSHRFTFKNTGDKPLLVADVKPSCGCTTPDWTKTEVAPGKEGYILVQFDSQGRVGQQMKTVTVRANIEGGATELHFTGEVVPAKK